jgi:hypothetical protein
MAVASLSRSDTLSGRYALVETRGRYVTVNPESICPVCHKRVGDTVRIAISPSPAHAVIPNQIIAVYPNSTLVHFKCMGKSPNIDPVTGTDFAAKTSLL